MIIKTLMSISTITFLMMLLNLRVKTHSFEPFILSRATTVKDGGRSSKRYCYRCFDDNFVGFCPPDREKREEKEKICVGQGLADGEGKTCPLSHYSKLAGAGGPALLIESSC